MHTEEKPPFWNGWVAAPFPERKVPRDSSSLDNKMPESKWSSFWNFFPGLMSQSKYFHTLQRRRILILVFFYLVSSDSESFSNPLAPSGFRHHGHAGDQAWASTLWTVYRSSARWTFNWVCSVGLQDCGCPHQRRFSETFDDSTSWCAVCCTAIGQSTNVFTQKQFEPTVIQQVLKKDD